VRRLTQFLMPVAGNCAINGQSMRPRAWICLPTLVLCLAGQARLASAQNNVDFAWVAPEGCPSQSSVTTEIETLLGGTSERAQQKLSVRATVERGPLWLVTLETRSAEATGHRTLEAVTCQALASATALIVALMIDPDAVAAQAKKAKPPEPIPQPAVPPPAPAALAPAPPGPPTARNTFVLAGLGASGSLGVLPGPDLDLTAALGVSHGPWRVELRGAYGVRTVNSDPLAQASDAYGRFRFIAGTLAGCWVLSWAAVDLGPCADAEFGVVSGEGVGQLEVASENTPWLGLGAGGALVLKATSWLHFPVHADAIVPLSRPNFVFRNVDSPIFRSWPVGGRLSAGVEVQF
jgi:hypothetical protein